MFIILAEIDSLLQHVQRFSEQPEDYRPDRCPHCRHRKLWFHGCYYRHSDRDNPSNLSLNPIAIPRFRCARCRRTCSVLPECLAPKRWYDWETQERALRSYLNGQSYRALEKTMQPARSTLSRWIGRLKERFLMHADHWRQWLTPLQTCSDLKTFWQGCLSHCSLAQAMRHLHNAGLIIP